MFKAPCCFWRDMFVCLVLFYLVSFLLSFIFLLSYSHTSTALPFLGAGLVRWLGRYIIGKVGWSLLGWAGLGWLRLLATRLAGWVRGEGAGRPDYPRDGIRGR